VIKTKSLSHNTVLDSSTAWALNQSRTECQ